MSATPQGPTQVIARRVAELRQRKGMTRQELGERLTEDTGVEWNRFTVSGLENGKRQNVTVVEWLALARVLDVAPLHLLVPLAEVEYSVTPQEVAPASRVREWVRGTWPLPSSERHGTDLQIFRSEIPLNELAKSQVRPATEEEKRIARQTLGMPEKGEADGE